MTVSDMHLRKSINNKFRDASRKKLVFASMAETDTNRTITIQNAIKSQCMSLTGIYYEFDYYLTHL